MCKSIIKKKLSDDDESNEDEESQGEGEDEEEEEDEDGDKIEEKDLKKGLVSVTNIDLDLVTDNVDPVQELTNVREEITKKKEAGNLGAALSKYFLFLILDLKLSQLLLMEKKQCNYSIEAYIFFLCKTIHVYRTAFI